MKKNRPEHRISALLQAGAATLKTAAARILRRNLSLAAVLLSVVFIAAPVVSFSPSAKAPASPVLDTAEDPRTAQEAAPPRDAAGNFDPDEYDITDYERPDYVLLNRGTDPDSDDLLFGSAAEEDMKEGLKAPPDMTFKDDDSIIYIHIPTLNMRELPTSDSKILRTLKLGEKIRRTGIGPAWDRVVDSAGVTGYVFNDYIGSARPTPTPTPLPKYSAPAKANTLGEAIAKEALRYLGVRYRWACADPDVGFDCSGLTWYVFNRYKIATPRGTSSYAKAGTLIPYSQIMPGDVIAWDTVRYDGRTSITHVAIYIGNGMMVHASSTHNQVMTASVADYKRSAKLISVHRFY